MGERISRLEWAKRNYKPGMAFKSAWSGEVFMVSQEPEFIETIQADIFVTIGNADGQVMVYRHATSEWGETIGSAMPSDDISVEKLIRRFESGAVRSDSTGRPRPDWVSPYAIEAISTRMVGAQNDFGEANYLLGIPELKCLESMCRHVEELKEAMLIEKDPVKIKDIASAVGFNITALLHTIVLKEKGLYKKVFEKEEELVTVSEAKKGANFTDK